MEQRNLHNGVNSNVKEYLATTFSRDISLNFVIIIQPHLSTEKKVQVWVCNQKQLSSENTGVLRPMPL